MNLFLLHNIWAHNVFKNVEATSKFLPPEGYMKQDPYWESINTSVAVQNLLSRAPGISASWKNTPNIKYRDHFTSTNFLRAKNYEKL